MANIQLSALINKFLQETTLDATEQDSIREDLGLKTTDAVTFKNLVLTGLSLTGSQATGSVDIATTWNTTGTPTAFKINVTDTASNAASAYFDVQRSGTSLFKITDTSSYTVIDLGVAPTIRCSNGSSLSLGGASGNVYLGNTSVFGGTVLVSGASNLMRFTSGLKLQWSSDTNSYGTADLTLCKSSADSIQLGENHATTPTAQTIKAHDVTTGTGASLTLSGGTGSVAKGDVILNGGNRTTGLTVVTQGNLAASLYNHGLLIPPLNSFSANGSSSASSISFDVSSSNSFGANHIFEAEVSTDGDSYSSANISGTEEGSGSNITLQINSLSPDTLYYFKYRSVAPNNSLVYSEWSSIQSQSTSGA